MQATDPDSALARTAPVIASKEWSGRRDYSPSRRSPFGPSRPARAMFASPSMATQSNRRVSAKHDGSRPHLGQMKNGPQGPVFSFGRGGGIRTHDPLPPRQVRYQAALRPDVFRRLEKGAQCSTCNRPHAAPHPIDARCFALLQRRIPIDDNEAKDDNESATGAGGKRREGKQGDRPQRRRICSTSSSSIRTWRTIWFEMLDSARACVPSRRWRAPVIVKPWS